MGRALAAEPTNLDVLLALGVSHTNELDSGEAVYYLGQWLRNHPRHRAAAAQLGDAPGAELLGCAREGCGVAAGLGAALLSRRTQLRVPLTTPTTPLTTPTHHLPADSSQMLPHAVRMFQAAAQAAQGEAELHMALGVLHHLGRNYSSAVRGDWLPTCCAAARA